MIFDVTFDTSYCTSYVAVEHEGEHSAEPHGAGVLPPNKPKHAELDVLTEVRPDPVWLADVEPLALKAKVDVLPRRERRKDNVHPPLILAGGWVEFDQLRVDPKRQIAEGTGLPEGLAQGFGDCILKFIAGWRRHGFPGLDNEAENGRDL
ncbi:MAG: hypothetical protein HQL41_04405 [Alphaproteobacteria bacterium]|nr:hypothetical protein [Alphaproteobacteria bacterium]